MLVRIPRTFGNTVCLHQIRLHFSERPMKKSRWAEDVAECEQLTGQPFSDGQSEFRRCAAKR